MGAEEFKGHVLHPFLQKLTIRILKTWIFGPHPLDILPDSRHWAKQQENCFVSCPREPTRWGLVSGEDNATERTRRSSNGYLGSEGGILNDHLKEEHPPSSRELQVKKFQWWCWQHKRTHQNAPRNAPQSQWKHRLSPARWLLLY